MTTGDDTPPQNGPRPPLAGLLRELRERALLTQEQLAERARVSVGTVRGVEAGRIRRPRSGSLRLLADALGLTEREREALVAAARDDRRGLGRPGAARPYQLPADVAGFTGRTGYLDRLNALVSGRGGAGGEHDGGVLIAAITGSAGIGKTALAVHLAHGLARQFPDGMLYLNLHGFSATPPVGPVQALTQLLRGLGVEADSVPVDPEAAAGLYRSLLAGRRVLVLLDNAAGSEQVRPLLPGTPGCVVVVTSRDWLGGLVASNGAHRLTLDVLSPEEAVTLLARLAGEGRFAAEPAAAHDLARLCGHLPLALRIAAANLTCHPEESLAGHVAQLRQGDLLTALEADGDPEAAVRVTFELSYRRLPQDAQRLFRLLGLMPGPELSAPAAAALAGVTVERAGRLLERLAATHLVEQRGPGRLAFHDLLRLYARDRAGVQEDAPSRRAAVGRLLAWYLHGAEAAATLLYPQMLRLRAPTAAALPVVRFQQRAAALSWLDAEQANLVAAVQHAAAQGPRPMAWLLADTLRGYFWGNRQMAEWLAVADAALRAAVDEGDRRAQAAIQRNLGLIKQCLDDYAAAAEHYHSAALQARQAGWDEGEAAAFSALGMVHTELGQLRQATDHYARSLALDRRIGSKAGEAVDLGDLGDAHRQMGRPEQAVGELTRALALDQEIGAQGGQAANLVNLGEAYRDLGRLEAAAEHLSQALVLVRDLGNRYGEAVGLRALALVHRDAGRLVPARELAESAVALAREIADRHVEADARNALGSVQLWLGCPERAVQQHRRALTLARQCSARHPQTEALLGLADAEQRLGLHGKAARHAGRALALASEGDYRILEGSAHAILAAVNLEMGRQDPALEHARQAVAGHRETGHRLGLARALVVLGHALERAEGPEAARPCWREALALHAEIGSPDPPGLRALLGEAQPGADSTRR